MRTNENLAPLYRSSIGFDRMFDLLDSSLRGSTPNNWPPYDIEKIDDDRYRISMAVAGFSADELSISAQPNLLIVSGEKRPHPAGDYLYRGIAHRPFVRRFELADYVEVSAANLADGLLTIDLRRALPEALKPRRVVIEVSPAGAGRQVEEQHKKAA